MRAYSAVTVAPVRGGKGGRLPPPPMLKKMALVILPNSMRKLRGVISISDVKKSQILNIFNVTVLFCTVFLLRGAIQSSAINVPPLSIVKMREKSCLFILISAYEEGVGHVYRQIRGCGQRKIFWGSTPRPDLFCPPNKNSWRRHCAVRVELLI